jgi:hypothetical protein
MAKPRSESGSAIDTIRIAGRSVPPGVGQAKSLGLVIAKFSSFSFYLFIYLLPVLALPVLEKVTVVSSSFSVLFLVSGGQLVFKLFVFYIFLIINYVTVIV